jgi:hypothetical protein
VIKPPIFSGAPMHQDYSEWEVIPESELEEAVEVLGKVTVPSADDINFRKVLDAGSVYKEAGLTPIYVYDDLSNRLAVYPEELQYTKLH